MKLEHLDITDLNSDLSTRATKTLSNFYNYTLLPQFLVNVSFISCMLSSMVYIGSL